MVTVILTGGASRRMGTDKASLTLCDRALVEILAERYSAVGPALLSVACDDSWAELPFLRLVDKYPGMGPLNGIVSAFSYTTEKGIFLTAVDLPYGDAALAKYLYDNLDGYDACVILRADGRIEPTFAAYSSSCLGFAVDCLDCGQRSFKSLFSKIKVKYIEENELGSFDLDRVMFNMNTPEDYALVLEEIRWN